MLKYKVVPGICLLFISLLAACGSVKVPYYKDVGFDPKLQVEKTARPGESIFSQWSMTYHIYPMVKDRDFRTKTGEKPYVGGLAYAFCDRPNIPLDPNSEFYCGLPAYPQGTISCLISEDGKTLTKHFYYGSWRDPQDIIPQEFKKMKMVKSFGGVDFWGKRKEDIYRYDLTYVGKYENSLKFTVSVYSTTYIATASFDKPNKVQEIVFADFKAPYVGHVENLEIEITEEHDGILTYKILAPFETGPRWQPNGKSESWESAKTVGKIEQ